jgi:nicotinamidase-related amidase
MKINTTFKSLAYTLLVVDMQKGFVASQDPITLNCVMQLIKQAMHDNAAIIFIELDPDLNGPTDLRLTNLVEGYPYSVVEEKCVDKFGNDGSGDAADACGQFGFPTNHFKVCGVNTNICVSYTVIGLATLFPPAVIEVIQEACNTEFRPDEQWNEFEDDMAFNGYADRCVYA